MDQRQVRCTTILLQHGRVPIIMCEKVSKELNRMERLGVIVKQTEPTGWCSPMVVVPKYRGSA